jgi:hypothetical protein
MSKVKFFFHDCTQSHIWSCLKLSFTFKIIYQRKPLFLILDFREFMNNCEFKEIIVIKDFEIDNGVLGLDRDVYLSIVKFLDSTIVRKV